MVWISMRWVHFNFDIQIYTDILIFMLSVEYQFWLCPFMIIENTVIIRIDNFCASGLCFRILHDIIWYTWIYFSKITKKSKCIKLHESFEHAQGQIQVHYQNYDSI